MNVLDYLQSLDKPNFNPNSSFIPLSIAPGWDGGFGFELRKELADNWGFNLYFGRFSEDSLHDAFNKPDSVYYKVLQLAKSNPDKYRIDGYLDVQNFFRKQKIPKSQCADLYLEIDGKTYPNPEMADSSWDKVVTRLINPLQTLAEEGVKFGTIQHWGEWFLPVFASGGRKIMRHLLGNGLGLDDFSDYPYQPSVDQEIKHYLSRRAYYEKILADKVKEIAPNRQSYNIYTCGASRDWGRYGGWGNWIEFLWEIGETSSIPDYAGFDYYNYGWNLTNGGNHASQINDLLSQFAASRNIERKTNTPKQPWVSNRYIQPEYYGLLKQFFLLGSKGLICFIEPDDKAKYRYTEEVDPDNLHPWLHQLINCAYTQAEMSWHEDFIANAEILSRYPHRYWNQARDGNVSPKLESYVLRQKYEIHDETGFGYFGAGEKRVVGLKHGNRYLICAWAADGNPEKVGVEIPDREWIDFDFEPNGSLYQVEFREGEPFWHLEPEKNIERKVYPVRDVVVTRL